MRSPALLTLVALFAPAVVALRAAVAAQGPAAEPTPPAATATAPAAQGGTAPAGVDDPAAYEQLVARVQATREERGRALEDMRRRLRELSDPANPTANDAAKRDLLVRRRSADVAARAARRAVDLYWLERSLTPSQRRQFAALSPEDRDALVDVRTVAQRLAVPLPPRTFTAAPVDAILEYVAAECEVRVVADWPALAETAADGKGQAKVQRRTPLSLEVGRYNRPAADTLADVVRVLTAGRGVVDTTHPDAAVVTTDAGAKRMAELDRKLFRRVLDVRAWDALATPLDPVDLTQVPLAEAVVGGIPAGELPPVYLDWRGLREAGLTPQTPVDLRLGVHTIGQRLAVLAEAVDDRPAVKAARGVRFDVHPVGHVIVSTSAGFGRVSAAVNAVVAAAHTDDARDVLERRLPELKFDAVPLEDALAFVQDLSRAEVHADWKSLAACGLTPQTPVTTRMANVPLAFALAVVTDAPAGRPAVEWDVAADGVVTLHGPQK
jgi:hypothetical protein